MRGKWLWTITVAIALAVGVIPAMAEEVADNDSDEPIVETIESPSFLIPAATYRRITIGAGESVSLGNGWNGTEPTIRTSNGKVVTADAQGTVTGIGNGTATIGMLWDDLRYDEFGVTVLNAPSALSIEPSSMTLEYDSSLVTGESVRIIPKLSEGSASAISYTGYDPSVVNVTSDGTVTAVGTGTTSVVVSTYNGKQTTCAVNVIPAAAEIRMAVSVTVVMPLSLGFPIAVVDKDGAAWRGAVNTTIVPAHIVDYSNGQLTGKKVGRAVITVTAGRLSAVCNVDVVPYAEAFPTLSIAHRGASGYRSENTLEAFRYAAALGADGVELDVLTTKDGVQVVNHNADIVVNKKSYKIASYTCAQLQKLKPDLCTLDEAVALIDALGLKLHMELKSPANGTKCVEIVRKHNMQDRTVYFSFYEPKLKQVYSADPTAILGLSIKTPPSASDLNKYIKDWHISFLVSNKDTTKQSDIDNWHRRGLKVCIWTVNDRAEVAKFRNMGADFILSNYPDYLIALR